MKSIQRRLTVSIVGGLIVLAFVSGLAFYLFARWMFVRQFDSALRAKARALATLVEQDGPEKYEMEFTGEQMPEFVSSASMQYFQVWLPNGQTLRRSPNLGASDLPLFARSAEDIAITDLQLPQNKSGRAVSYKFIPNTDDNRPLTGSGGRKPQHATVVLARDRHDLDQVLQTLLIMTLIGAFAVPFLAAIVVSVGVRKGLKPVHSLAAQMQKIKSPVTTMSLTAADYPRELQPMVIQLNSLMARLHEAFLRERRFTMDASHELRTPLAEAGTALEVASRWPDDIALLQEANRDALQAIRSMEVLVSALLTLARGEAGMVDVHLEPLDLAEQCTYVWKRIEDKARSRGIALEFDNAAANFDNTHESPCIMADRVLLTSVLHNLLENAVEYSPDSGAVDVTITGDRSAGKTCLTISNTMETPLSASDVSHAFEPFWRKDSARTTAHNPETPTHSGLGLALAKTLCTAMGISIQARADKPRQFIIELEFPTIKASVASTPQTPDLGKKVAGACSP